MGAHTFRHGELPLVVLALLESRPMHGYELLAELAERFGPAYQPSPGSLYPAVAALKADGLIRDRPDGTRRVLRLTAAGARALSSHRSDLVRLEERLGVFLGATDAIDALLETFLLDIRDTACRAGVRVTAQLMTRWAAELRRAIDKP